MSPTRYDAAVVRRLLATVPTREAGVVVEVARFTVQRCSRCGVERRHFMLDSGDAVCIRCCGPGEDFGGGGE